MGQFCLVLLVIVMIVQCNLQPFLELKADGAADSIEVIVEYVTILPLSLWLYNNIKALLIKLKYPRPEPHLFLNAFT